MEKGGRGDGQLHGGPLHRGPVGARDHHAAQDPGVQPGAGQEGQHRRVQGMVARGADQLVR